MKKYLIPALALGLVMTSCQSDEPFAPVEGGEKQVTFTLNVPGELGTRAAAGENESDKGGFSNGQGTLYYTLVLDANGDTQILKNATISNDGKTATFTPTVVLGRDYTITAYASFDDNSLIDERADVEAIAVSKNFNNESKDAYFHTTTHNFAEDELEPLTLKRPFGKLRLLATDYNVTDNAKPITDVKSVTVEYTSEIPNQFDAVDGIFDNYATVASYTYNWTVDGSNYVNYYKMTDGAMPLFADYIPANGEDNPTTFKVTVTYGNGETYSRTFNDIPVKRNALTTLKGAFFTAGAEITVTVEDAFDNSEAENIEFVSVGTNAELKAALEAGKNVYINNGEYTFPASKIKAGQILTCADNVVFTGTSDLNIKGATVIGAKFSNQGGQAVSGTIYGTFKNCVFEGAETLRWCYTTAGQTSVFENCVVKTTFRGVHFDTMDGDVIFRNCEINGFNAYSGAGTITFDGCTFGNDESNYNGLNIYSNTLLKDCTFNYVSGKTNFIDLEGTGKTLKFENCSATLDGAPADIYDFVGGSKKEENTIVYYVATQSALNKVVAAGATNILLAEGRYEIEGSVENKSLVISGVGNPENVILVAQNDGASEGNCDYCFRGSNVEFNNLTIQTTGTYYPGYAGMVGTFNNCIINGTYACYKENTFNNCTFNVEGDLYNLWTWGGEDVNLTNCTFNCDGKAVLLYGGSDTNLTVNNCVFNDNGGLSDLKAAIETGNDYNKSYNLVVNNTIVNGFAINDKGINTGTTLWANKNSMPQDKLNVVVDGVDVY